ncbi:uncharacterized protein LOC113464374 isoform X2 [Ceratina calcarata]|uniref:Uncharacterized protein LOC113464374 isoform X2 n=1 Tax=Ceratina calcarata TaxID=156304 RepID=A0AAJ7S2D4_9HYME|nr:uncharacterized protein LOC113464374 isoform X2 [Ceratina calcarata]
MRNNFVAAFLPLVLTFSTSQSFWVHGSSKDSLKRNSLPDTFTGSHPRSTSTSNYECLYVDPSLPSCDYKLMLNSEETTSNTNLFKRNVNRSIDVGNVDVIVYTIEGCLPSRLPFTMPSCDGISLDRIVDVRRLRSFSVKGVTKPPFVFPKFNYSRWLRMVKQLQNHASTKTRHIGRTDESSLRQSVQDLTEELMNAATTKETMPNAIAASMKTSNGSSPNKLIPGDTRSSASTDQLTRSPENACNDGNGVTPESSSNTEIPPVLQRHNELNSDSRSNSDHLKSSSDGSKMNAPSLNPDISEIPAVQKSRLLNEQSVMKEAPNVLSNYANSKKSLQFPASLQVDETDNGLVDDLPLTEIAPAALRRRREIRLHVSGQEIGNEPKVRTVTGEPISRFHRNRETSSFNSKQFSDYVKSRKQFNVRVGEEEMMNKNMPMVRTPLFKTKSDSKSLNKVKYGGWFGSKPTWQKMRKYRR